MIKKEKLPEFISELMYSWLKSHKKELTDEITVIGLFKWKKTILNKNLLKPRLSPKVEIAISLRSLNYRREVYFNQISSNELEVYQSNGFFKAGSTSAKKHTLFNNEFVVSSIDGFVSLIS
jgi:hypothetical protein